jgi:ParB family chromosome partitioning protein
LERSEHVAEWVRLTEEKLAGASCADQLDARGQKKSQQQMPSGINAASKELGIDRTEAQRADKISKIAPWKPRPKKRRGLQFQVAIAA